MNSIQDVKLKDIADIDISSVDKKTNASEKSVKLCNFTDVYNNWSIFSSMVDSFMLATANDKEIDRFSLSKGMLAITKDSETRDDIGIATLIEDDLDNVVLGYHTALIKPDFKRTNSSYLNGYLHSKRARKYFSNQASGSGQRYTLTVDSIGEVKILLPHLNQQQKIGALLSAISRKILINNKINDNLSQSSIIA